jgi:hypothetical protein
MTETPIFEREARFVNLAAPAKAVGKRTGPRELTLGSKFPKRSARCCDRRHGRVGSDRRKSNCRHGSGNKNTTIPLSRAERSSRGKGKPQLASSVQGSPVAARYRPPAPATGPRAYLGIYKRKGSEELQMQTVFSTLFESHELTGDLPTPRPRRL